MDERVEWAVRDIARRLDSPLTVRDLAAAVNLTPSRFTYLFRRDVGMSPARFVRSARLEHARILLETTFLTVKEVMAAVGIHDASHFARDFRRHHGLPPRAWRRSRRSRPR
jgi:AraC family transcriptional regulator of arabinose operon